MQTVAILGLGLMGSSLGLALKKRGFDGEIRAYARRQETCDQALALGVADVAFTDPAEAVRGADISVVCVPIQTIPSLIESCLSAFKAGAIITDVGSTKAELLDLMAPILSDRDLHFIGSHPIAGSEKTGVDAGSADLYDGRMTIVTPSESVSEVALKSVCDLWEMTGSTICKMDALAHDSMMARTSHLPHLAAAALVLTVDRDGENAAFCGTGFKDTTRVASGSSVVWRDIVATNRQPIIQECEALQRSLGELITILKDDDSARIEAWLAEAARKRDAILKVSEK